MLKNRQSKSRASRGATEIAQFPLTIYCLFLVVLLPVLNLVTLIIAGTTAFLATNDLAAKAATQSTFAQALNAMAVEAYTFQSNNLARFVKMAPQGGYTGCGSDLFVLATDIGGSGIQSSPADQSLTSAVDTTKSIYEMQVVSSYSIVPLVSFASIPLLGSIPGLGQPVTLAFAASRPVEHPGGLTTATTSGSASVVSPFNRIAAVGPGAMPQASAATWRNPNIYQQIQNAGQTIVSTNVFVVQADNPNFTSSGVTVLPGQKVWIDTQATGTWNIWPGTWPDSDANGLISVDTSTWTQSPWTFPGITPGSLVGQVGSSGTPFIVGDNQYNYPPSGTGLLQMMDNDAIGVFGGDTGSQLVRVIVVQ